MRSAKRPPDASSRASLQDESDDTMFARYHDVHAMPRHCSRSLSRIGLRVACRALFLWLVFAFPATPPATAESAEATPGLEIGKAAPDFELNDGHGAPHTLQSMLSENKAVAVVFHRSADW